MTPTEARQIADELRDMTAPEYVDGKPSASAGDWTLENAASLLEALAAELEAEADAPAREDGLRKAVDKFLAWKLPEDFHPDCGISFDGRGKDARGYDKGWPVGTNLFTADQALAMFRYCLAVESSVVCPICDGLGESIVNPGSGDPWLDKSMTCPDCNGSGRVPALAAPEQAVQSTEEGWKSPEPTVVRTGHVVWDKAAQGNAATTGVHKELMRDLNVWVQRAEVANEDTMIVRVDVLRRCRAALKEGAGAP